MYTYFSPTFRHRNCVVTNLFLYRKSVLRRFERLNLIIPAKMIAKLAKTLDENLKKFRDHWFVLK